MYDLRVCCVSNRYTLKDIFLYHVQNTGYNSQQMIGQYVNKSQSIYIRPARILNSDEFPERQLGYLIMSTVMDCIINLLFTLLQIGANDMIISHIVITRGYQKVLSLRHFPHSDSTMLHT